MNNLFKETKFGDKFLTRDGKVAIFWFKSSDNKMSFIVNNRLIHFRDNHPMSNQKEDEIVSRYHETINEEELDKLACAFEENQDEIVYNRQDNPCWWKYTSNDLIDAYKSGYKKCLEQQRNKI